MLIASRLHFTPPPPIARAWRETDWGEVITTTTEWTDDRFASPAYLPCITAYTLVFTHSPTPLAVFCRRRPLRAVQMVIMWTAPLTDQWTTIWHRVSRPKKYRPYYPIHANIAQYPITQYRYRSNPSQLCYIQFF